MNRRSRKTQDVEGDRSHIPREERSYVEYHPRLLTHLALTLVRQATSQHKRTHSRGHSANLVNAHGSVSSASDALKDHRTRSDTPTASNASNDLQETQRDDMYACDQITKPNGTVRPTNGSYAEAAANLFELDPSLAMVEGDIAPIPPVTASIPINSALFDDVDEIAAVGELVQSTSLNTGHNKYPSFNTPEFVSQHNFTPARSAQSRVANILPSDRFLRSEVSVEEKYERLRREEGFSIGKLHEPRFRKLDHSVFEHKVKLTGNAIAFGYQADRPFQRSGQAYTRTIDLPESELADRVEYDMDEQDDYWLTQYNERRKMRDGDTISREIFEITLTKIEKEWTALEKRIPKLEKKEDAASEDAKCAICDDGECENTNAIVFCDGCNLAVHQDCYGVPYIPEGQWLCRKCFASPMDSISCLFCPSKQGAFKQTSDLHWAHLLCTNWIPEVTVGNPVFMEPIEGVLNIPPSRWKLTCYICKLKVGACIQCSNKTCYTSFHVSCARRARLFLQQNPGNIYSPGKSFCDRHVPDWYRVEHEVDTAFADAQTYFATHADTRSQTLIGGDVPTRGKFVVSLKRSKQSAVIPAIVFSEILLYMQKFRIRNKADFIADLCKYWSLKRRSRRGVSLLKRLQVQIEDSAAQKLDNKQRNDRLEFGKVLLGDLDDSQRPLLEDVVEREIIKSERCEMRDSVIEQTFMPLQSILKEALSSIEDADTQNLLSSSIPAVEGISPDQSRLVWPEIVRKVHAAQYLSIAMFETDLACLMDNIMVAFPDAVIREHKLARKLQDKQAIVLEDCRFGERALAMDSNTLMATCFDNDYEPKGLSLLEEKPFNWANRDASPLSDLDDSVIEEMANAFTSPFVQTPLPAKATLNKRSSLIQVPASRHVEIEDEPSTASKACDGCRKKKVRCDGRDSVCHKSLAYAQASSSHHETQGLNAPKSPIHKPTKQQQTETSEQPIRRTRANRSSALLQSEHKSMPKVESTERPLKDTKDHTPGRISRAAARELASQAVKRKLEEEMEQQRVLERPSKKAKGRRR